MRLPAALVLAVVLTAAPVSVSAAVALKPVPEVREFPDATAPAAIQRACASELAELARHFLDRGLRFEPGLVRPRDSFPYCHVYYEPSLPGFRASGDEGTIVGLHGAIDPLSFIARRKPVGDSLDVIKTVLGRAPRAVDVTLSVAGRFDEEYWPEAQAFHFGGMPHPIRLRRSGASVTHPWAQDHFEAGVADGKLRILTPRRLFEGRGEDGALFAPLLDLMSDGVYVRSKLSWEGGDLQFVRKPSDPSKLVMLHGSASRAYWGRVLDPEEAAYVLRVEFGADESIDLGDIGPHVDYLVAFLPGRPIALVSEPVRRDPALLRSAVAALRDLYGDRAPALLQRFASFITQWGGDYANLGKPFDDALAALASELPAMPGQDDPETEVRLDAYVERHCKEAPDSCFLEDGKLRMLDVDPELLRAASDYGADYILEQALAPKLLALIEAQASDDEPWKQAELRALRGWLEGMGFSVVGVPYLNAPRLASEWSGISYVNLLAFEGRLFVPTLGLGAYEEKVLARLRSRLPRDYEVVPVWSRSSIIHGGGVHCVFGIVRAAGDGT